MADSSGDPTKTPLIGQAERLSAVLAGAHKFPRWLLTHKPFTRLGALNAVLHDASEIDLIVSGHLHQFNAYVLGSSLTPQLIVGDSGTELDNFQLRTDSPGAPAFVGEFGYLVMSKQYDGWEATLYGASDEILAKCTLLASKSYCVTSKK